MTPAMSWWWAGAVGAVKKRQDERAAGRSHPSRAWRSSSAPRASSAPCSSTSCRATTLSVGNGRYARSPAARRAPGRPHCHPLLSVVTHLQLDLARAWLRLSGRSPTSPTSRGRPTRLTTRTGRSTLACSATCSSWHFVQLCSTQLWSVPS